ncbi:MAG: hypothetical protein M9932_12585 [Xanthobacteraceae bacterium]|nr:hypothetical protein [Xanthobacteraceae bacterium]
MSTSTAEAIPSRHGGYRFIPGVSQYSGGVGALPGYALERVRFSRPVPLAAGFDRVAAIIKAAGQPLTAFCACELRSPKPFTEQGFRDFNTAYTAVLSSWGIVVDGVNPVARSNVCPQVEPPAEPSFHAFTYVVPAPDAPPSFMISGSAESEEGPGDYRSRIVRLDDTSPEGMREKAVAVLKEMERRMSAFSGGWPQTTGVQIYTVHDIFPFVESELGRRGALGHGLTWHFNRPPVVDLEYEMDCRRIHRERVVEV